MPSDPPSGPGSRSDRRVDVRDLWSRDSPLAKAIRPRPARGRRVRRTIRHVEPWSVLKLALLFHAALFLVVCVASALLWSGARASGQLDNLEGFITSVGGFGNCEPVDGEVAATTTTTRPVDTTEGEVDQLDPNRTSSTAVDDAEVVAPDPPVVDDDEDCPPGERLTGAFQFEDARIFQGFALAGLVLVLAGSGTAVVLVLLFNLMSDLVGGVEVTVIEEEPRRGPPGDGPSPASGSPRFPRRD